MREKQLFCSSKAGQQTHIPSFHFIYWQISYSPTLETHDLHLYGRMNHCVYPLFSFRCIFIFRRKFCTSISSYPNLMHLLNSSLFFLSFHSPTQISQMCDECNCNFSSFLWIWFVNTSKPFFKGNIGCITHWGRIITHEGTYIQINRKLYFSSITVNNFLNAKLYYLLKYIMYASWYRKAIMPNFLLNRINV